MPERMIRVRVFRFDPSADGQPHYVDYQVPCEAGSSAMNVLDYIYEHLDGTLAYYDHAGCGLGVCGRCTGRINGKAGLLCQTPVEGDVTLEPLNPQTVVRDLVCERKEKPYTLDPQGPRSRHPSRAARVWRI